MYSRCLDFYSRPGGDGSFERLPAAAPILPQPDAQTRIRVREREQPEEEVVHSVDGVADPRFLQLGPGARSKFLAPELTIAAA